MAADRRRKLLPIAIAKGFSNKLFSQGCGRQGERKEAGWCNLTTELEHFQGRPAICAGPLSGWDSRKYRQVSNRTFPNRQDVRGRQERSN